MHFTKGLINKNLQSVGDLTISNNEFFKTELLLSPDLPKNPVYLRQLFLDGNKTMPIKVDLKAFLTKLMELLVLRIFQREIALLFKILKKMN
jgi:hypothetical protein